MLHKPEKGLRSQCWLGINETCLNIAVKILHDFPAGFICGLVLTNAQPFDANQWFANRTYTQKYAGIGPEKGHSGAQSVFSFVLTHFWWKAKFPTKRPIEAHGSTSLTWFFFSKQCEGFRDWDHLVSAAKRKPHFNFMGPYMLQVVGRCFTH